MPKNANTRSKHQTSHPLDAAIHRNRVKLTASVLMVFAALACFQYYQHNMMMTNVAWPLYILILAILVHYGHWWFNSRR